MPDQYSSFAELLQNEVEGVDFEIEVQNEGRDSRIVILAPHAGMIEPGTAAIARSIAGTDWACYVFRSLKPDEDYSLHITSHRFDEPGAIDLAKRSSLTIAVHGKCGSESFVMIGGRHEHLIRQLNSALADAGVNVRPPTAGVGGRHPANICNRCSSGEGVQLELSRGLRKTLTTNESQLREFADTVRQQVLTVIPADS